MRKFFIVIEKAEKNFSAYSPDLPGCVAESDESMVKNIPGLVAGGYTVERILKEYSQLTEEDVSAALKHASDVIDEERVVAHG